MVSPFLKKCDITSLEMIMKTGWKLHPGCNRDIIGVMGKPVIIPPIHFCINNKNLLIRKKPQVICRIVLQWRKKLILWATFFILAASNSICHTLCSWNFYLRSFSVIQWIIFHTSSVMNNLQSATPVSFKKSSWTLFITLGVLAIFSLEYLCLYALAELSVDFPHLQTSVWCHKLSISGNQRSE